MKIIKIIFILALMFILTSCKEYGEKRIVKLLTIDKNEVSIHYYNYENEEITYDKVVKKNNGIENTLVEILSENNYDLKLCKFCIIDFDSLKKRPLQVFTALSSTKFSPDINIVASEKTSEEAQKYIDTASTKSPVYDFKYENSTISGVIQNIDTNEKNIIVNNKFYKTLNIEYSILTDILTNQVKNVIYPFEYKQKKLSAELDNISVFYSNKSGRTQILISAKLYGYKGLPAGKDYRNSVKEILRKNIKKNVTIILNDKIIVEQFNLMWYDNVEKSSGIDVVVKII